MKVPEPEPTTVSFTLAEDGVWIDKDNVAWKINYVDVNSVVLERTVTIRVPHRTLVKAYREPNEHHPLHPKGKP